MLQGSTPMGGSAFSLFMGIVGFQLEGQKMSHTAILKANSEFSPTTAPQALGNQSCRHGALGAPASGPQPGQSRRA